MEFLLNLDRLLFGGINHLPHTPFSDSFALFFSGAGSSGVIWLAIGVYLFFREERRDRRFFISIAAALGFCIVFVEGIAKYIAGRPRPDIFDGAIIIGWAEWYSFPSSHAAISWAMASIMSKYEPKLSNIWYILAGLISLSRIYLGVHFPFDVLVGSILGWGIGNLSYRYFSQMPKTTEKSKRKKTKRTTS